MGWTPKSFTPEPTGYTPKTFQPVEVDPSVSTARAGTLGFAQGGTLGFADELGGALGKLLLPDRAKLGAGAQPAPDDTPEVRAAKLEALQTQASQPTDYALVRDLMRKEATQAKKDHKAAYMTGEIGGGIASALAMPGGAGGQGLKALVKTGAMLGAAGGLGASDADLAQGEYGKALLDTGLGAGMGAAGSALGYGVARALPTALRAVRQSLQGRALDTGRKVLTAGSGQLARGGKRPLSDAAVQEALDSGGIAPWGTTAGAAQRLGKSAEDTGAVYASILDELETAGVKGPQKADLAMRMFRQYVEGLENTGANKAAPNVFRKEMENALTLNRGQSTLGLTQAENVKRALQEAANYERMAASGVNDARKAAAGIYRQANEEAVAAAGAQAAPDSPVQVMAESFVPVKQRLGRLLEARNAAERGAAAGAHRVGGAAGINTFDVAQAAQATGSNGLPAMALAAAQRVWKERGPSTLASLYNTGAGAAGGLANWAASSPGRVLGGAYLGGAGERALLSDALGGPVDEKELTTRAIIEYLRRRGQ